MGPEAVELDIHIHNDFQLWKVHEAIEANLAKKIVRGVYSPALAVKGWLNLVDRAAKSYARDNSMPSEAFDARMRKSLALEFERRFYRNHIGMYKSKREQSLCSYAGCGEKESCSKCRGCKTHHVEYGCSA